MARLDIERQQALEPKRIASCKARLEELGIVIEEETDRMLKFKLDGSTVTFWPYSGWFSGKTVPDDRGFKKLERAILKLRK